MQKSENKSIEDVVGNNVFLKGLPEIAIIKLVRRVHSAQSCPHKGNCLNEEEMCRKLTTFLTSLVQQSKEEERLKMQNKINEVPADERFPEDEDGYYAQGLIDAIKIIKGDSPSNTPKT